MSDFIAISLLVIVPPGRPPRRSNGPHPRTLRIGFGKARCKVKKTLFSLRCVYPIQEPCFLKLKVWKHLLYPNQIIGARRNCHTTQLKKSVLWKNISWLQNNPWISTSSASTYVAVVVLHCNIWTTISDLGTTMHWCASVLMFFQTLNLTVANPVQLFPFATLPVAKPLDFCGSAIFL